MRKLGPLALDAASLVERGTPALRIADDLLRRTLIGGGLTRILEGDPGLVVVTGISEIDGGTFHQAGEDLLGGTDGNFASLQLTMRDWTDPERFKPNHVERFLLETSTSRRAFVVLCRRRADVPAVVATVADGVVPLADRREVVAHFIEEITGVQADDALTGWLVRLPLAYLNLVLRAGTSRDRMWQVAGKLRRQAQGEASSGTGARSAKGKDRNGTSRSGSLGRSGDASLDTRPERLEDLPGMGEAQRWGLALAADLARYRAGTLPWDDIENGVLLHGPPGTGKTLFARALAGSCGVPLHVHSVAAWQARGHLGDMLKAMRAAFDEARKAAPAILFIDELDSIGRRDEPLGDNVSYQRQVINGLLECLDGTVGRGGVVVVGATNNKAAIDAAVLRAGRLGRHIEVELPDLEGRVGILRHHLRGDLADLDLVLLADDIGEVSGATLAQVVREARAAARREKRALSEVDLRTAVPPGILLSDEAFRRLCVHEAGHVVVGLELATTSGLIPTGATVRRRTRHKNAHRTDFQPVEGFDTTRRSMEAHVVVLLAGLAAEEVILGTRGAGSGGTVESDLVRATQLAATMERHLGLGESLVSVPWNMPDDTALVGDDAEFRCRIDRMLDDCLREARLVVERQREDVEAVAARLAARSEIRFN